MRNIIIIIVVVVMNIMLSIKLRGDIGVISAGSIGTGGAGIGNSISTKAMQYNVGGLGLLKYYGIEISHKPWYFNIWKDQINVVTPMWLGGLGVSVEISHSFFNRDNYNYVIGQKVDKLNDYSGEGKIGYGIKIMKNLGIGIGINYHQSSILGKIDSGISFDVGGIYRMKLFSKIFGGRKGKREDFTAGISVKGIGDDRKQIIRGGIGVEPFPWIKLLLDGDYIIYKYYENEIEIKSGIELSVRLGFTKFFLRGGYSIIDEELQIGSGIQLNLGERYYRVDYARGIGEKDIISSGNFSDSIGAFSLSIGESELLLKLIRGKGYLLSESYYNLADRIEIKKRIIKREKREKREYKVGIGEIKTEDKYIKGKKYDIKLRSYIIEEIEDSGKIKIGDKGEDIKIGIKIAREGELMRCIVEKKVGEKVIEGNIFEKSITYSREGIKNYKTLDVVIKKEKGEIKIIPKGKGEEDTEDKKKIKKMAKEIANWIEEDIEKTLSGEYRIISDVSGVEVYVDGEYKGRIEDRKEYKVRLLKGKHKIILIKANRPAKEVGITALPGEKKDIKVSMMGGRFYVGMKVATFPKGMKVRIDGKEYGKTPIKVDMILSGEHKIEYETDGGDSLEEEIEANREGIFKIYGVKEYEDEFKSINKEFWNEIRGEKGIKIKAEEMLRLWGSSKDGIWHPSGIVSREFKVKELKIETKFKVRGDKIFGVIGIIDERGNGIGLGIDNKYFQYYDTGKNTTSFVPAINFRDKSAEHKLEIRYEVGAVTIMVDDMIIVENKEVNLRDKVRVMILTDNEEAGKDNDFEVTRFALKNEF